MHKPGNAAFKIQRSLSSTLLGGQYKMQLPVILCKGDISIYPTLIATISAGILARDRNLTQWPTIETLVKGLFTSVRAGFRNLTTDTVILRDKKQGKVVTILDLKGQGV